ncbi:MAG: putative RND superfamily exporter protein [Bradymonadia bacterium]
MSLGDPGPLLRAIAAATTRHRASTLAVIGGIVLGSLGVVVAFGIPLDFTPQALFETFEDQQDIDARFVEHFGATENVAMVLVGHDDVLNAETLQWMHTIGLELQTREYSARVESVTLTGIPRAGPRAGDGNVSELLVDSPIEGATIEANEVAALEAALASSSLLDGILISDSRSLATIAVFLADGYSDLATLAPAIEDIESLIAIAPPAGTTAEVGGLANIRVYMVERFRRDQSILIPIAMLICALCLLLSFRWWPATILPTVGVGLAGVVVLGGMAIVQEPFNIINQVVPTLMIVIGISDAIHLVSRYLEELRDGNDRCQAAERTVHTMAAACFLTSFTTAIGFGSLLVSKNGLLSRFGMTAAFGVMVAYVVTIFFLPAALTFFRPPKLTRAQPTADPHRGWIERFSVAVVRASIAKPWLTLVGGGLLTAGMAVLASTVVIDTSLLESFPPRDPTHQQTIMLQEELDGVLPIEVSLSSEQQGRFNDPEILNALTRVQSTAIEHHCVLSSQTYGDLLHEAWAAYTGDPEKLTAEFRSVGQVAQLASLLESGIPNPMDPYVTRDRRHLRVNFKVADCGSRAALLLAAELRVLLDDELEGVEGITVELTGDAYSGSLGLDSLIRDMFNSLSLAFVFIFGLLSILFRSLRLGLISIPANVTPLIATMAYMALIGINLNTTTVVIFSVSIGLAVDDTIHMLARFREERARHDDVREALLAAAAGSGKAIVVTSIMLSAGMSVMLISSFMPVRLFGELVCVTLAGCLLSDLVILPAMLVLFAKK